MAQVKRFKQENYTAVADFMLASLQRDLEDFTKVFRTMDSVFLEEFKKANDELKNASTSLLAKQQQKEITQSLYAKADDFKDKLILLRVYAKRSNLDTPLLQDTINSIKSRNIEKVVKNTREILPFFVENANKIKDMPSDFLDDVPKIIEDFESKNTKQNSMMSQRKQTTAETKPLYEKLYNFIKEVAEAGKIIYKNSSKKDDYIIGKVLSRVETVSSKKEEAKQ